MANKRMFALTIVDSDAFLDMPQSTQLLYFHLGMRADDDGFINNAKTIMRIAGCKEDDLKLLIAKKFIIPFESGVVVIKHRTINNYIQKDRYHETKYLEEKAQLNIDEKGGYTLGYGKPLIQNEDDCIQDVSKMDTQVRLGKSKVRLGKNKNSKIELDKTRYKQSELCEILLKSKYLNESEIQDLSYDETLDDYVMLYGYVDTKIKLKYFVSNATLNEIDDKYLYFKTSMDKAFNNME